jgi:hypothetical protein
MASRCSMRRLAALVDAPLSRSSTNSMKDAKAHLFGRWQPGHQVTITVSHPDYVNLSRFYRGRLANLSELPEHLTKLRQRHNVLAPVSTFK